MSKDLRLSQVIAVEKGVKARVTAELSKLHHDSQKPEKFAGYHKAYKPRDEEGETFPPERKKVEMAAGDTLATLARLETDMIDVVATKDKGNQAAQADLVVDGTVLIAGVPVTHLLFLEKRLVDARTFIDKLPTLDEAEDWTFDTNVSLYRTGVTQTHRTRKVPKVVIKYEATKEHPAQTELLTEDVIVGWWEKVSFSGALPVPEKRALLERVDTLLRAVKVARDRANATPVVAFETGAALFNYILSR